MTLLDQVFADHFAQQRAIDSAWRWILRTKRDAPVIAVSEVADRVMARCPTADRGYVASEISRRLANQRRRPTPASKIVNAN